eukprot:PhM_4_TR15004/c0_g1_i1/m.3564
MSAWESLWSVVGHALPECGLPQIITKCMNVIEGSDAATVYHCVSGYGATTAGEAVDAARIVFTYLNQLTPPLLPAPTVAALCIPGTQWEAVIRILATLPPAHYAALYGLLKHCYNVTVTFNVSADLLAGYYCRAIFKTQAEELRPLLSVFIVNFVALPVPNVSAVDETLRPLMSEVVHGFLGAISSPYLPSKPEDVAAQRLRVEATFGPLDPESVRQHEASFTEYFSQFVPLTGQSSSADAAASRPIGVDADAEEDNRDLIRSLPTVPVASMSEKQLRVAKSDLKHRIHAWEDMFRARRSRAPTVQDKQPVREAYDTYKQLKLRLEANMAERHYAHQQEGSAGAAQAPPVSTAQQQQQQQQATTSSPQHVNPNSLNALRQTTRSTMNYGGDAPPPPPPPPSSIGGVSNPAAASTNQVSRPTAPHTLGSAVPEMDEATLQRLKDEKHNLKKALHEFEASVRNTHGRQPTREDRRQMYAQYARYGELKNLLAAHTKA